MFSKEESKQLRQEFWIAFGKSYPYKWTLYNTKVKGLTLKFHFDLKTAMVALDIETTNLELRIHLWEKLVSLKAILLSEYLPNAHYEESFILDNRKEISRIHVQMKGVSIHNKNSWQETMQFLYQQMILFERFFRDYEGFIRA